MSASGQPSTGQSCRPPLQGKKKNHDAINPRSSQGGGSKVEVKMLPDCVNHPHTKKKQKRRSVFVSLGGKSVSFCECAFHSRHFHPTTRHFQQTNLPAVVVLVDAFVVAVYSNDDAVVDTNATNLHG